MKAKTELAIVVAVLVTYPTYCMIKFINHQWVLSHDVWAPCVCSSGQLIVGLFMLVLLGSCGVILSIAYLVDLSGRLDRGE